MYGTTPDESIQRLSDWLDAVMYFVMKNYDCLVNIDSGDGLERHRFLYNGVPVHKANLLKGKSIGSQRSLVKI